jgi:hypothetical protein
MHETVNEIDGVALDERMGAFLGWYAAEGSIRLCEGEVTLAFGRGEEPIAEDIRNFIKERFGRACWYHNNNGHPD